MVVQELQQVVRLFLLEPDNATSELRVDEERLLACRGMCSNKWMHVCNRIATDNASSGQRVLCLFMAGMDRLQTVQPPLELRGEAIVRLDLVAECRVASSGRSIEEVQESCTGRLLLICHVRVPCDAVGPLFEVILGRRVSRRPVNEMHLRISLGRPTGRMNMRLSIIFSKVNCLLNWQVGKVLVTEGCTYD